MILAKVPEGLTSDGSEFVQLGRELPLNPKKPYFFVGEGMT